MAISKKEPPFPGPIILGILQVVSFWELYVDVDDFYKARFGDFQQFAATDVLTPKKKNIQKPGGDRLVGTKEFQHWALRQGIRTQPRWRNIWRTQPFPI